MGQDAARRGDLRRAARCGNVRGEDGARVERIDVLHRPGRRVVLRVGVIGARHVDRITVDEDRRQQTGVDRIADVVEELRVEAPAAPGLVLKRQNRLERREKSDAIEVPREQRGGRDRREKILARAERDHVRELVDVGRGELAGEAEGRIPGDAHVDAAREILALVRDDGRVEDIAAVGISNRLAIRTDARLGDRGGGIIPFAIPRGDAERDAVQESFGELMLIGHAVILEGLRLDR